MDTPIRIVGLGVATLDVLVRLRDMPTWDRGAEIQEFGLDGGGMTGTALAAAARLGAAAGYLGTVGSGLAGELKLRSLADGGVDTSRVRRRAAPENQVVLVCIDEAGERVFSGVKGLGGDPLRPDELDRAYLTAADCLLVDGFHFDAAVAAARWMREAGKIVLFDGIKTRGRVDPSFRALLAHTSVLVAGSGFAAALTGEKDIWKAGRAALATGPDIVVQTEGADGCYTVTADDQFHTPVFPVEVVDTTGAGDVFHGAYAVGLLRGWPLRHVAALASAVAAIKCTRLGGRAGIPTMDEALTFLRDRGTRIG